MNVSQEKAKSEITKKKLKVESVSQVEAKSGSQRKTTVPKPQNLQLENTPHQEKAKSEVTERNNDTETTEATAGEQTYHAKERPSRSQEETYR